MDLEPETGGCLTPAGSGGRQLRRDPNAADDEQDRDPQLMREPVLFVVRGRSLPRIRDSYANAFTFLVDGCVPCRLLA